MNIMQFQILKTQQHDQCIAIAMIYDLLGKVQNDAVICECMIRQTPKDPKNFIDLKLWVVYPQTHVFCTGFVWFYCIIIEVYKHL